MAWTPPESDIDVGAAPIDRVSSVSYGFTVVGKDNPANASGALQGVKIYVAVNMTGLRVGTFYITDGNTLKCRDSATIGNVTAGSEQTFTEDSESNLLAITVVEGDYIGAFFTTGYLDFDVSGGAGAWIVLYEYIDPGDETTYAFYSSYLGSLYGYGDIEAPPVGLENKSAGMAAKMIVENLI